MAVRLSSGLLLAALWLHRGAPVELAPILLAPLLIAARGHEDNE